MECTGYILFFTSLKEYYSEYGDTEDPFQANFYVDQSSAIEAKNTVEEFYRENVKLIKVKKNISILGIE